MNISADEVLNVLSLMKSHNKDFLVPSVTEISHVTNHNPFHVLMSCLISLRTKDAVTIEASKRLFAVADTPEKLLRLPSPRLERLIYPAGFYKTKARRMKEICRILLEQHRGKVPSHLDDLMKLPGVGRKTATITLVYGFGSKDYIPADVHVHVIANRLGWVSTKRPEDTEQGLMRLVPRRYWPDLNDLFVQFGQNICVTISPRCSACKVRPYCKRVGVTRSR